MVSCGHEVLLNRLTLRHASWLRIAWLCLIVAFAMNIQHQPSAALPLSQRAAFPQHDSPLIQFMHDARAAVLPRTTLAVKNVHSLLTTPKLDPMPATSETNLEGLSIRTELRTQRTVAFAPPLLQFSTALAPGVRSVLRRGSPTITAVTERVTLWNNVIVDRQTLSRVVVQTAHPAVIVAAPPRSIAEAMAVTGIHRLVAVYAMMATAYTAGSAQSVPTGRTATGLPARYGVVAVDPRVIRLGSRLFIPGYGTAIAADTGGDIVGNRIDLCMDSYRSALLWGRQPVKVYVLAE
jgi:3D (Asp-Asp-Asp) domain-containing protein